MKLTISALILFFLTYVSATTTIKMLEDLLTDYKNYKALTISAFVCKKIDSLDFAKHLSRSYQINFIPSTAESIQYPVPTSSATFIINLNCPQSEKILKIAHDCNLFAYPFKWILYHESPVSIETVILLYFRELANVLVDSDVTLAVKQINATSYGIKKVYRIQPNSRLIIEDFGILDEGVGLTKLESVGYKRRRNLRRAVLNTCNVITDNDTLNHLTDKRFRHIDSIAKVNYVLVRHLSDTVNAVLNYSIEPTWGYKDNNSQWNGMIGQLTRNEAEIGGTALFLTSDRIDIIQYIAMTTPTRSKFIFRQPKLSYVTNVFTLPFTVTVWLSTIGLLCVIAVVLYAIVKWEWRRKLTETGYENRSNVSEIHNSMLEVSFITFGALCQQGTAAVPYSVPGRITLIFLFVSFMFLYTSYSANIVALLQSSSNNIHDLKDLLNSRLEIGVDNTVFNHFYFPNATEPVRRAIYVQKVAPPGQKERFYNIEYGIKRMQQGLFAFHVETGPGYKFVSEIFQESEKCGLQEIQYLQVPDPWLAIKKNSSYKKMLTVGLRQLQEAGIQEREVSLIYTKKPQCLSRQSSFISVGLVDCYPAAVVLAGGLILGVGVLILEIYVHGRLKYYRNRRQRQRLQFTE